MLTSQDDISFELLVLKKENIKTVICEPIWFNFAVTCNKYLRCMM